MQVGEHDYGSNVTIVGVRRDEGRESTSEINTVIELHGGFDTRSPLVTTRRSCRRTP